MAQSPMVTKKTSSNSAGQFSETVEFKVLHCANITGNNNKFYCIEIQKDPTNEHYRLFSHYGRLGVGGVYEVRENDKDGGNPLTLEHCTKEFNKIIKKKQTGKSVKRGDDTIRESYSVIDVLAPTVGSSNICNASSIPVSHKSPMVNTSNHDSESSRLIRSFINENVHSITSNTTIQFTTRGFETPLGPVTESHLDRAGESLNALRDEMNGDESLDGDDRNIRDINSAYYSLIPRRFGSKITTSDMILTPDLLAAEYDLIDNLRTAVQAGLTSGGSADTGVNINVALMDRGHVDWDRLSNKFETTKHRNHAEIKGYRVKNIFYLNIPTATNAFRPVEKRLSNVYELFHGTKTANMLSIALNGLIIPPTGAAHVTGRMFGNGVYGASCSTKALNYAVGYWGGTRNKSNTAYMLITEFAMGNTYIAKSSMNRGAPSGYDSIWAQAGSALLNDEYIVYNLNQVNITHLLELEN